MALTGVLPLNDRSRCGASARGDRFI